jgi:hypothetical protein
MAGRLTNRVRIGESHRALRVCRTGSPHGLIGASGQTTWAEINW